MHLLAAFWLAGQAGLAYEEAVCEVLQWRMAGAGRSERLREIKRMLRIGLRDPRCTYYGVDVSWYSLPRYQVTSDPVESPAYELVNRVLAHALAEVCRV